VNFKKGLTRFYIVGWALWLVSLTWTTLAAYVANSNHLATALLVFVVLGLALPAGLLWALRWAADGLSDPSRNGS